MSKVIYTKNAPDAIGPYSQGIITGNLLFTSGQIAINPATGNVEAATIEEQTEQVCKNIGALLEAAGASYENVIKTTCFLADMGDFAAFNAIYGKRFPRMFFAKLKLSQSLHKIKRRTVWAVRLFCIAKSRMFFGKAPLCKGSCRGATEGLFYDKVLLFTIPPSAFGCHLPLHKGGFSSVYKQKLPL